MKSYTKSQLALLAGISINTLRRWMSRHRDKLESMGVFRCTKLLPPKAVEFVCEEYGIDLNEEL